MTTPAMLTQEEFSKLTQSSDRTVQGGRIPVSTISSPYLTVVQVVNADQQYEDSTPNGFISLADLIAKREAEPGGKEALAKGRQRLYEHIYQDLEPSLTTLRLKKGVSQKQLAEKIGTHQSHIAKIENGGNVQMDTIKAVADALELPAVEVFTALFTRYCKKSSGS